MNGFGHVKSNYMLMQVSLTWAFKITENFSFGIQPNFNYAALELAPNPLSSPSMTAGYPESDNASAIGFGAQFGLYYASKEGMKVGVSYKTPQAISELEFKNTYLDGSVAPDVAFRMDYPAIFSFGLGYSTDYFDITADYRNIDYSNTDGFADKGWTQTGSVKGFGWKDVNVLSAGLQLKLVKRLPIRLGYTYSSNPIDGELAFFSIPATAVIKNAYQFGLGYHFKDKIKINAVYHYGSSGGSTKGNLLNPMMASPTNPYGAIPNTTVSYKMTTSMVMVGISYDFSK
jgi:long-chain fatty acid transport protein